MAETKFDSQGIILPLYQGHGRKRLQGIVSGSAHHGQQLHKVLLSLNLKSGDKNQNVKYHPKKARIHLLQTKVPPQLN